VAQADFARHRCPKGLSAHNFHQLPFVTFNRKDHLQHGFVEQAFGLPRVGLKQLFVPSCEGQVRAVLAGWGVSVLPELRVRELLARGELVNLVPRHRLSVMLYWHCWNLSSDVLESLTKALAAAAAENLKSGAPQKTPPGRGSKRRGTG
jgi:LysR family transcriptional regulator (chromosome initiation inhibitor)